MGKQNGQGGVGGDTGGAEGVHVVIPTHTARHLDMCLVGMARQRVRPLSVTVSCDVDDEAIEGLLRKCASELGLVIRYVRRPHEGKERLAQVRNNAVRALVEDGVIGNDENEGGKARGRLLFLDGDTLAEVDCVEKHLQFGRNAEMVLCSRINLTEAETAGLDGEAILQGEGVVACREEEKRKLLREHRKAVLHQFLRKLGLTKAHKPKLLGGHHSVSVEAFMRVNGHDEEYHTWGTEDDDFARRVYRSGGRSVIAIRDILVYHLYHPTRSPVDWHERENAVRFARKDLPVYCRYGLSSPYLQERVRVDVLRP